MEKLAALKKKGVTIVVVGDSGTGKSTLIQTAASGAFTTNVASVLPPTRLHDLPPVRVPVTVIDTSAEQRSNLQEQLRLADAVVLTYACDRPETRDRLSTHWLPEIRQLEVRVPIVVVGCRLDLKNGGKLDDSMSLVMQIPEIDVYIECSACRCKEIAQVFYCAKEEVLYPTHPLIDRKSQTARPQLLNALKRIFILCDHDKDGSLSEAELNDYQVKCFDTPFQPNQMIGLKWIVEAKFPEEVKESGLTLRGFIFLHTLLIKNCHQDILWKILRKFGYNNDIRLDDNLLPPSFKRAPDQSVELTDDAFGFLKGVFSEHDYSKDGLLQPPYLECLFSTAPDCPWNEGPYKDAAPVSSKLGFLTVDGFLSEWVLMTLLDPAKSMEYLKYLTYNGDASSAIRLTRRRRTDRKKQQSLRNVYQCFVFGPKKAGKSALMDAFLKRPFSDRYHVNTEERYAVYVVDGPLGSKKFLVLREIPEDKVQMLLSDKESLVACDVAIFVYDSSDELSLKKTADLLVEVAGHGEDTGYEVPSLLVAAKADMNPYLVDLYYSTRVSQDMGIELPISISVKSGDFNDIFRRIVSCAEQPHLSIPQTEAGRAGRSRKQYHRLVNRSLTWVSVGAVAIAGLTAYRFYATGRKGSS